MKCGENLPDVEYVLSLSYGKDSIATIEACKQLGQRIDRIVHAEVWATQDIPAELPPMVEFKEKADKIIFDRYGLKVERVCAMKKNVGVFKQPCEGGINSHTKNTSTQFQSERLTLTDVEDSRYNEEVGAKSSNTESGYSKKTYEDVFYRVRKSGGVSQDSQVSQQNIGALEKSKSNRKTGMYGFPQIKGNWCTGELKNGAILRISHQHQQRSVVCRDEERCDCQDYP